MRSPAASISRRTFAAASPALLLALAAGGVANADVITRSVALSGQHVGAAAAFDSFADVRLTSSGEVFFTARLATAAASNDQCDGAIPVSLGGTFISTVGATNGAGACPNLNDVWSHSPPISPATLCSACGPRTSPPGSPCTPPAPRFSRRRAARARRRSAFLSPWVSDTSSAWGATRPVGNAAHTGAALLIVQRLNAPPGVGFPFALTSSFTDDALFGETNRTLGMILREGDPVEFDPAVIRTSLTTPAVRDNGGVALVSGLLGNAFNEVTVAALYTVEPDGGMILQDRENPMPPPAGNRWTLTPFVSHNEQGTSPSRSLTDRNSATRPHDPRQCTGPGLPDGVTFAYFDQPAQASDGGVVFRARVVGPGVTDANNFGLWADRRARAGLRSSSSGSATPCPASGRAACSRKSGASRSSTRAGEPHGGRA